MIPFYIKDHFRAVAALIVREMATRFGRKPGGYIWALLDPAAHIAILTLIFKAIARVPGIGTNFTLFFATGYIAFQFYTAVVKTINPAVRANKALLNYPNVAPIDTIVSRVILQVATTALAGAIIFAFVFTTQNVPFYVDWTKVLKAIVYASSLAVGIGMANNVLFNKYPLYEKVYDILTRPLFLISGVFFIPEAIPHPYREYLLINPLSHVIMLFRQGFYPQYRADGLDEFYLLCWVLGSLFIGLYVFTSSLAFLRNME